MTSLSTQRMTRPSTQRMTSLSTKTMSRMSTQRKDKAVKTAIVDKTGLLGQFFFGGLVTSDMSEEVHRLARKFGTVSSVTYPLPEEELKYHGKRHLDNLIGTLGLAQDGCKTNASFVLYTSVKSACECVAALHQKEIHGGSVWALQLGGEGSNTQKWKLIVRNLPFKAKVAEIKDMFASVGFVWDFIPQNPGTGSSKGFAFVKFTLWQWGLLALEIILTDVWPK